MPGCNVFSQKEAQFKNMRESITRAAIKNRWKHKIDIVKCTSFLYSRNESETVLYPNSNKRAKRMCCRHILDPLNKRNEIVCVSLPWLNITSR